jgi:hypothetical protein
MKMELLVNHILALLKQLSTFAEDCQLKLTPNGVGFFVFNLPIKHFNVFKNTENAMPKMPV